MLRASSRSLDYTPRRMIFRKRYNYRFGDIDHAGIAYYPSLLHYFHVAMEDWWEEGLGRPYPALLIEDNYGMPAVKLEAEFFAPISYGDKPEICVGVLAVGNKSVFEIRHPEIE